MMEGQVLNHARPCYPTCVLTGMGPLPDVETTIHEFTGNRTKLVMVRVVGDRLFSSAITPNLSLQLKFIDSSVFANYLRLQRSVAGRRYQAMKTLMLLLSILAIVLPNQNAANSDNGSSVVVVSAKWSKSRLTTEQAQANSTYVAPASAVTQVNKNYEKRRVNASIGERDPEADTTDGRAAQLDRIVQEARTPQSKAVDGYAYRVKLKNSGARVIEILFWEYQFSEPSDASTMVRRQFLCSVNLKPSKEQEVLAFSLAGPSDVVSVVTLADKAGNSLRENVVINRVEYADGSIWQRRDWRFAEVKLSYARAVGTPWGTEMCRAL